jgi:hypothetical protein
LFTKLAIHIIRLNRLSNDEKTELLKYNGRLLKYIEDQTYEMCESAVIQNPFAIKYA